MQPNLSPLLWICLSACIGGSTSPTPTDDSGVSDDSAEDTSSEADCRATGCDEGQYCAGCLADSGVFYTCVDDNVDCGRPLDVGGLIRSPGVERADWGADPDAAPTALREDLGLAWLRQGLSEHASIGSFARFVLDLLAVGAPPELLAEAHAAAADEVRHAQGCFRLASRYAGRPLGPGPLALPAIPPPAGLAEVAVRTLLEGCLNETVSAALAMARRAAATDAAVVAHLEGVIADESRHAALAWRTVAWALRTGGGEVAAALQEAAAAWRPPDASSADPILPEAGWPSPEAARRVIARATSEVIRPALAALFSAPREPHATRAAERPDA